MRDAIVQRQYVDTRFGQSHVYRAGPMHDSGLPPLMCFHMSPRSAIYYHDFLAEMGKDRLVVAVDTPGFGNSDATPRVPTLADFAAAMGDVADGLGFKEFNVLGHQTGSKIAVEVARQRAQQVQRVVIVGIGLWTEEERAHRGTILGPAQVHADGRHVIPAWAAAVRRNAMPGESLDRLTEFFFVSQLHPRKTHWGHIAAADYRAEKTLAELDKPVLVLDPDDDLADMTPRAKSLLKHPDSEFRRLPGWAIFDLYDVRSRELAQIARAFVDQHKQRTAA
jgi:pimeloyl-ACP methyl ester carboxylesterase